MKEIEFSHSQFDFLIDNFPDLMPVFEKSTVKFQSNIVSLENEQIEYLLDGLSKLLSEQGVRPDSEPNELGYFIESIIDPLNRAFYISDVG
ncbi:hypothetical protein [Dyadobacter sandarakinus]|uniref:Uncharacterized protein n=1 Tax=Dyadobacter sandarakinus TaxID=2747268 RepID=A0ABX7I6Y6_9BACT|nr:hypothetical protein [Dyadobacter sandarakinus]QRR01664.1 hypothetical protein HWI92_12480 [Dyadobacter sandarakinus]